MSFRHFVALCLLWSVFCLVVMRWPILLDSPLDAMAMLFEDLHCRNNDENNW